MKQGDALSDPAIARIAWARFRVMMRWIALVAFIAIGVALAWLHHAGGLATIHMVIATIAGVGCTVLLAGGLMMAAFLSSGSGHDAEVARDPREWK